MIDRKIVLENGAEFFGTGFGARRDTVAEIVFNTSMAGYQEVISDPSYTGQTIVMTYPLIGNYGITDEDFESRIISPGGLIVRRCCASPSNFRYTQTVSEVLEEAGVPGIEGIDTRMLTRVIRDEGSQKVLICDSDMPHERAMELIRAHKSDPDVVSRVSCKKKWYSRTADHRFNVVAIDCGIKFNIVRRLNEFGCNMTVVPYDTPAEEILALRPDGLFLSNGPGDPENVGPVIETIRRCMGKLPIFGICLGHQMIALACGAKTYKMKFGHRGGNHPVKNLLTGRIEMTSQNHSYAVDSASLEGTGLELTHINLLDNTAEGMRIPGKRVFSVQYHPESAPGPQDSLYLFEQFTRMMEEGRKNA